MFMNSRSRNSASNPAGTIRSPISKLNMMQTSQHTTATIKHPVKVTGEATGEQLGEQSITTDNRVYTVFDRYDGLGSHILQALLVCLKCNLDIPKRRFAIPKDIQQAMPKMKVDHNYENDPCFTNKSYDFIGLWRLFPYEGELTKYPLVASYNECSLDTLMQEVKKSPELVQRYFSSDIYTRIVESWREDKQDWAYRVLQRGQYGPKEFHLSMHVRRLNPCDDRLEGQTIPLRRYIPMLEKAFRDLSEDPQWDKSGVLLLHVFSQGEETEFLLLNEIVGKKVEENIIGAESKVVLHLCESVFDTYVGMAMADALITSPSGLSIGAALYSKGPIYASAGWYFTLPTWQVFDTGCGSILLNDVYHHTNRVRRQTQVTALRSRLANTDNWRRMTANK